MRRLAERAPLRPSPRPGGRLLCPGCVAQRRRFAAAAPPASGLAALPSRRLLAVTGPHAAQFLQGIITANLHAPPDARPRSAGFYAGFLNATGRVLYDVFVYPFRGSFGPLDKVADGGYLVEVDAAQSGNLARHIKRYKLRARLDVRELLPDEASVWQAWDDAAADIGLARAELAPGARQLSCRDPRAPGLGYRVVKVDAQPPQLPLERAAEDAYTLRRYLRGVPEGQDEIIREQALPLESNMDLMDGLDFRKGCYVGQELTIRTRHRGVVRKRILPCIVYESDAPAPTALAYEPAPAPATAADAIPGQTSIGRVGKHGRSAGKWLKGMGNIGLALCRLEAMTGALVPGQQQQPQPPQQQGAYDAGDEFVLEWAGGQDGAERSVKVKAFVPAWMNEPGRGEPTS
ncbi:hypothetical protein CDD83_2400 [Cordyceps sp. RAO-2017]|nr:hypothetical protein CDD83_2400 [Cordyceps sp. RAO-2017]